MANSNNPDNQVFHDPEGREITITDDDIMTKFFDTDLYQIFCAEVLEFSPGDILITDESSLEDFPESIDYYVGRVKSVFNLDISDMDFHYIGEILQRIVSSREIRY
jgi:hypothetical protein